MVEQVALRDNTQPGDSRGQENETLEATSTKREVEVLVVNHLESITEQVKKKKTNDKKFC